MCSRMRRTPAEYAAGRASDVQRRRPGRARRPATRRGHRLARGRRAKRAQVSAALEVGDDGPEAGGVQGRGVAGDIAAARWRRGRRSGPVGARSRTCCRVYGRACRAERRPWRRPAVTVVSSRSTLRKRVFELARESARVQHVAGPRSGPGDDSADVAQLVEHHLAKVRVASSNLVVRSRCGGSSRTPAAPGGVAERRGNGLQSRLHGFKSRLHLQGRLAQRESASLTRKRSLVQSQYRPLDPASSGSVPRD